MTLTTGALTIDFQSTLTGTDSFVATGLFTLIDFAMVNIPGTIDAYGGVTVISATLSGVTLNNYGTATWRVNDGNGVGIGLNSGAVINNLPNATFAMVDFYGGAGIGGDGTGEFNNSGTVTSTAHTASINVPFNSTGSVNVLSGGLLLGTNTASPSSVSSGPFTAAAGTTLLLYGQALSPGSVVSSNGMVTLLSSTESGSFRAAGGTFAFNDTFTGPVLALGDLEVSGTVSLCPRRAGR